MHSDILIVPAHLYPLFISRDVFQQRGAAHALDARRLSEKDRLANVPTIQAHDKAKHDEGIHVFRHANMPRLLRLCLQVGT